MRACIIYNASFIYFFFFSTLQPERFLLTVRVYKTSLASSFLTYFYSVLHLSRPFSFASRTLRAR